MTFTIYEKFVFSLVYGTADEILEMIPNIDPLTLESYINSWLDFLL